MSGFRITKSAITTDDSMFDMADLCTNTTVGPNKYQLFCLTQTDLDGSCRKLPASLTSGGELDCWDVTSQPYLQKLYDTTGMACAVNCYYPLGTSLPSLSLPPFYTSTFPSYTYTYPPLTTTTTTTPLPTGTGTDVVPTALNPNTDSIMPQGGASMMDPNFLFTFMAVFAVMILCVRRAI